MRAEGTNCCELRSYSGHIKTPHPSSLLTDPTFLDATGNQRGDFTHVLTPLKRPRAREKLGRNTPREVSHSLVESASEEKAEDNVCVKC